MRRHKTANVQSEPRVTRYMVGSNRYASTSTPTSPSEVMLNRSQNLQNILRPTAPLVPESILIGPRVQVIPPPPRRSSRNENKEKPDYKRLNKYGKQLIQYILDLFFP